MSSYWEIKSLLSQIQLQCFTKRIKEEMSHDKILRCHSATFHLDGATYQIGNGNIQWFLHYFKKFKFSLLFYIEIRGGGVNVNFRPFFTNFFKF